MTSIPTKIETAPRNIPWTDLTELTWWQRAQELTLPLPWLVLSLWLYATAFWPLGLVASFMVFLCGLRLNHEAIHANLAMRRINDHRVMHMLSGIMMGSNNAEAYCHLQHHRDPMGPSDHEGKCGEMSLLQVLTYGPRFPLDVNLAAWRLGGPLWRRRMMIDWGLVGLSLGLALVWSPWLLHVLAMLAGQALSAFFAVWITHQGIEGTRLAARSQRGWLAKAAYLMFYHREHHLFPKVPVSRLPVLARRLDKTAPGYASARRAVIPWLDTAN